MSILLRTCDRGTSTIELAFVAPLLTLFVLGMSDLASAIAGRYSLTRATIRASELALSRGERDGGFEYLRQEAATAGNVPLDNVQVEQWLECNYEVSSAQSCTPPAISFKYVKVTISGKFEPKYTRSVFGDTISLFGSSVVRVQ